MTEIEGGRGVFKAVALLYHVLTNQIESNDGLRAELEDFVEKVVSRLAISFDFDDETYYNLRKEAFVSAQSTIEDLNEKFGQSPAYQVDQQVERVTRKRQRASKTPLLRNRLESYASAQVNFEDRFVNDSIDSPMRGDIVPRRFDPNPAEVENPTQYVEEESLGDSTRQSVATGAAPDRAYVGGLIESVRDESSIAQHSEVTSVSFQPADGAMALRRAKSVVCDAENEVGKYGCAAVILSLYPFMTKITNCIVSGNQGEISSNLGPMHQLLKAKVFCAQSRAIDSQQKAEKLSKIVPASLADSDIRIGEILHLFEATESLGDDNALEVNGDWTALKDAIRRRDATLGKKIDEDKYCSIGHTLKNRMTIFLNLFIVATVMSELRLCEFCNPALLQDIIDLSIKMSGSNAIANVEEMTVECFVKVLVPALNSGDDILEEAALRILITMVLKMRNRNETIRTKFEAASLMRVDNGVCSEDEGSDSTLDSFRSHPSHRRSDMLTLWFCIIACRQIEAEFPPGFFATHGGFVKTILRCAWKNIKEDGIRLFPDENFFTILSPCELHRAKAIEKMTKLLQRSNNDEIEIVISDREQLESIRLLCSLT